MEILIAFIISMCIFSGFHPARQRPVGEMDLNVGVTHPVVINQRVKPLSAFLDQKVIKQEYDFSCGSAALCTLLDYYLGENLSERQVIEGLMEVGNKRKIAQRRAFSLLDMKKFVAGLGYRGVGYKAEINDLKTLKEPAIIPISLLGYRHFTVFRGIHGNHIFLADPFKGQTSYTLTDFKSMWYENVLFIVYPQGHREINALRLTEDDLRYIDEFSHENILELNRPHIPTPSENRNNVILPDDYHKYNPY